MARRTLDFRSFEAMLADVEALQARGYERAGQWTLEQACEHLTMFMRMSMEGFVAARFPWQIRLARPFGRLILRQTLRWRRLPAGVRGPDVFMPKPKSDPAAVEAFRQMCVRMRDHAGACHPSPLFGPMTSDQWREIHLIHGAHHLSFLLPRK